MAKGLPTQAVIDFGRELKSLRIKKGLYQQDLVNISEGRLRLGSVIAIENGKYNAGISQVLDYADVLGYKLVPVEKPKE